MKPQPYHIHTFGTGILSAMAMPDASALQQNLQALRDTGIDKILCLLEEAESEKLGLQSQEDLTIGAGMEFYRFPITDFSVPDILDLQAQAELALNDLNEGKHLLVHCKGGVGRTGLICCCLMLATGVDVAEAISTVTRQRGEQVPESQEQIDMLIRYAARYRTS